jgi:hypothetical protein
MALPNPKQEPSIAAAQRTSLPARGLIALVRLYQCTLAHLLGGHCRFHPTCSVYAIQALRTHGAWRGGWLAMRRLCRCNPWTAAGEDPVPPRR